jgi:hypothetical protein
MRPSAAGELFLPPKPKARQRRRQSVTSDGSSPPDRRVQLRRCNLRATSRNRLMLDCVTVPIQRSAVKLLKGEQFQHRTGQASLSHERPSEEGGAVAAAGASRNYATRSTARNCNCCVPSLASVSANRAAFVFRLSRSDRQLWASTHTTLISRRNWQRSG